MKQILFILSVVVFVSHGIAQEMTISGKISDAMNGEDLIGASVVVKSDQFIGTTSNQYGFYSLSLKQGEYEIKFSFIGYEPVRKVIVLNENQTLNIALQPKSTNLKAVEIVSEAEDKNVKSVEMGVDKINVKDIEMIPVLFGERDVMKTIQLLPGIKSAGEGNSGFFVRGGSADQNLILLDGAPVYNASHLLGFFSIFNSDALKDVKIYKGSTPAKFGGRLSSVMDVKMKEGNMKKFNVNGGIGLIASRLTIQGPIVKDKSSFIISGRRTYGDLFLGLVNEPEIENSGLFFYDLNAKFNYKFSDKDRLYFSNYYGRDRFDFDERFSFDWGNLTSTLRWNHIFNEKLFLSTSFIYSNYDYDINLGENDVSLNIGAAIQDLTGKSDIEYYVNNKNTIKAGLSVVHHLFRPGTVEASVEGFSFIQDIENRYSLESSAYISNEQKINGLLSASYGLRFTNFTQFGPGLIYDYDNTGAITDSNYFDNWEVVKPYNRLSPRVGLNLSVTEKSAIKASYNRNFQFLHLISNTTSSFPTDLWMPSSNNIKPQTVDQFAVGYFQNFKENKYEFSSELYYKEYENTIGYRNGADIILNPIVESELIYGEARAYGIEFMFKKRSGKLNGWLSYTLAKTERLFEEVNQGEWFNAKEDRTHDVSLVLTYQLTDRITASTSWVYYTGNAVTFPVARYNYEGRIYEYFSERNAFRMPDYHRWDLGLTFNNKATKSIWDKEQDKQVEVKKKFDSSWNFSVYNVYARENAYSIRFESNAETGNIDAIQLSLFKIVPSISYNFNF